MAAGQTRHLYRPCPVPTGAPRSWNSWPPSPGRHGKGQNWPQSSDRNINSFRVQLSQWSHQGYISKIGPALYGPIPRALKPLSPGSYRNDNLR
jgi:hypothetical protein